MIRQSKLIFQLVLVIIIITNSSFIQSCPIYLTIALNGKNVKESFLEINWGPNCLNDRPEWIGVFREDPSISYARPDDSIHNIRNASGKYLTNVRIGEIQFPGGWNKNDDPKTLVSYAKGKCLQFYVAGYRDNDMIRMECLKIQPNWMGWSENIGKVPLKELFIPGTHSSGAYDNTAKHQSALMRNYGCAQNLDVWSQLVFGIRFLNFKIGYRNSTDSFWVVNENMMIAQVRPILQDIKRFVTNSGEIVILDFSAFPIGFTNRPDRHSQFLDVLIEELGDLAYQRFQNDITESYDLTMNDIRHDGKYILISYPMDGLACLDRGIDIIWPSWKRFTIRNFNNSESLDFMRLLFSKKDLAQTLNKGWIFEGTRGLEESLNTQKSLQTTRYRAYDINSKISNYLGGPWSMAANVVTLDFFSTTNLVDIAIYSNTNKAFTYANNELTNFDINQ